MSNTTKLNQHLKSILDFSEAGEAVIVEPTDLLTPNRLDVIAKYLYAKNRKYGEAGLWSQKIYRKHLKVINGFKERDGSGKSSFDDFLTNFNILLDSIEGKGFDSNESMIPIDRNGSIIDGSHRLAACLLYKEKIKAVPFKVESKSFNAQRLINIGLSCNTVEQLVLEYCYLKDNVRVAVLFPVAKGNYQHVVSHINKIGGILYEKEVTLSKLGRINLVRVLYHGEPWANSPQNKDGNSGIHYHVIKRFDHNMPIRLIVFEADDLAEVSNTKTAIRNLFEIGNDSIHINDHSHQTTDLLDLILSANGLHWMNNAVNKSFSNFNSLFESYRSLISEKNVNSENYCLDGSAPLAVYGLRDVGDLDYLNIGIDKLENELPLISNHDSEVHFHNLTKSEIIVDPDNHVRFRGMKIISLRTLKNMKKNRAEPKDNNDVLMIDKMKSGGWFNYETVSRWIVTKFKYYRYRIRNILAGRLPKPIKEVLKFIYLIPSDVKDRINSDNCKIDYLGFSVSYSYGTSIIQRIKISGSYEPEVTHTLCSILHNIKTPVVLDIGANIGLISLNILNCKIDAKIYAFEPGADQFHYLKQNVSLNNLEKNIVPLNFGLSDVEGENEFYTHISQHSSGDGFLDTNRAGDASKCIVKVKTLDNWWVEMGRINIDLLKIDTEGSELMILKGALKMISSQSPKILLEIHPDNLDVYPYSATDILNFFEAQQYSLKTLTGLPVTHTNLINTLKDCNDFIASQIGC